MSLISTFSEIFMPNVIIHIIVFKTYVFCEIIFLFLGLPCRLFWIYSEHFSSVFVNFINLLSLCIRCILAWHEFISFKNCSESSGSSIMPKITFLLSYSSNIASRTQMSLYSNLNFWMSIHPWNERAIVFCMILIFMKFLEFSKACLNFNCLDMNLLYWYIMHVCTWMFLSSNIHSLKWFLMISLSCNENCIYFKVMTIITSCLSIDDVISI
jgi:hypothetical protein